MPYIGNVLTSFAVETGNINDQAITSPKLSATGGTDGQVLALDSNGDLVWSSDPAGQWVTSGDDIFYTTGNVGIGVSSPGQALDVADVDIAPLRVTRDQAVSSGAGLVLRQPDTTDGNDLRIYYQTDTTGTGASSDVNFAALEFTAATHDHSTRAGEIGFYTAQGGTGFVERLRIDGEGNIDAIVSTTGGLKIGPTADNGARITTYQGTTNNNVRKIEFEVQEFIVSTGAPQGQATTEAYRVDADGRLLVGATSASYTTTAVFEGNSNSATGQGQLYLNKGDTTVADGTVLGLVRFGATGDRRGADIRGVGDGSWNAGSSHPTSLLFMTTAASATTPTEWMRLDSRGHLLIGDDTGPQTSAQSILQLVHAEGPNLTFARDDTTVTTNEDIGLIRFYTNDSDGTYEECARIAVEAESAHSDTSKPSYIRFMTTAVDGTSPTEKLRITSSGRIGIGDNDPNATVQIAQDSLLDGVRITVAATSGVSNVFRIRNQGDTSTFGMIKYDIDNNRMIFNRGGDVAGFTSDGLTFGADTAAANALDDYEEGTWTPAVSFGNGTTGITYARQEGIYTKIGNVVHLKGTLYLSNKGTSTGVARLTGFPYDVNTSGASFTPIADRGQFNLGSGYIGAALYLISGTTNAQLYRYKFDGAGNATVGDGQFGNQTEIDVNFSYQIA